MKDTHKYLILIITISFILRLVLSLLSLDVGNDTGMYLRLSKNLADTGTYYFGENYNWGVIFSPGYPIFVSLLYKITNNIFLSGKIISLLFSIITIPMKIIFFQQFDDKIPMNFIF